MAGFRQIADQDRLRRGMHEILQTGSPALNALMLELGRQMAEFILYAEREELAGPDYDPRETGLYKWASEQGSLRVGGQKVLVKRPRPRLRRGDKFESAGAAPQNTALHQSHRELVLAGAVV